MREAGSQSGCQGNAVKPLRGMGYNVETEEEKQFIWSREFHHPQLRGDTQEGDFTVDDVVSRK